MMSENKKVVGTYDVLLLLLAAGYTEQRDGCDALHELVHYCQLLCLRL